MNQKNAYWIFFESFNRGLSSITKKKKIESVSRPLVDFGVLNDNLIKYLISCVKWISNIWMRSINYSLIHHLKYNFEANETIWSTCIVNKQIVPYWRIYVKSSKKSISIRRSWILTWFITCDLILNKEELIKCYI
jgi:hypothetical protein